VRIYDILLFWTNDFLIFLLKIFVALFIYKNIGKIILFVYLCHSKTNKIKEK